FDLVDDRLKILEQEIAHHKLRLLFPILAWLKTKKNQLSLTKVSIVHRDFHPHNIIINNQGKPFVIDWPASGVGDFREDLGWTLLLISVYTFEELRDQTLNQYENMLGKKVEYIEYFEVLAILRRLYDIMLIFQEDTNAAGFRKEAKKIVKQTSTHLEKLVVRLQKLTNINTNKLNRWINSMMKL
ncbi:MAG: aminoglycoside phosphotransferase family protein, partial [Candidatus Heimdallarchaeaceae archaeon]